MKIRCTPEFVMQALFPDKMGLVLNGLTFDGEYVYVDIAGPDVPEAEHGIAVLRRQAPITVEFEAAE